MQQHDQTPPARWVSVVVVFGAVLMAMGSIIALTRPAMMVGPYDAITPAVRTFIGYFAARNLAMALLLLALLIAGARRALGNLLVLVGLVQILDAAMGCIEGRWTIAPGVTLLGIVFLIAAAKLCGAPFWQRSAWIP